MSELDPLLLSRIQFAFTISFHILFPSFTIALAACFLEAGFLGIMLFGWKRVPRWVHFFATCMVALGTAISAFWILSANSWMQTPQGFRVADDGVLHVTDWWQCVFNS